MSLFKRMPANTRLLAFLSLALLPIGIALTVLMLRSFDDARRDQVEAAAQDAVTAATALESHLARTVLAARLAANGALEENVADPCGAVQRTLSASPGLTNRIAIGNKDGSIVCTSGNFPASARIRSIAPGATVMNIGDGGQLELVLGLDKGSITAILDPDELRRAYSSTEPEAVRAYLSDGNTIMRLIGQRGDPRTDEEARTDSRFRQNIADERLEIIADEPIERLQLLDRIALALPLIMWVLAGLGAWYLIHYWVIAPLARLRRAVARHEPGEPFDPPARLGPTIEVQDLSDAFSRTVDRIDESESQMADALEGQRKLVREVHHRVKNNLQVIASLLSIHGRSAQTTEARAAYSAIGRRVDALSVVHRNHFAEVEENRGIALRPMLTELAAGLRATAPERAKNVVLDLSICPASTTQDAAVSAAFFVTEIVEFSMIHGPVDETIEINLVRDSELTANLSIGSSTLMEPEETSEWQHFERIVEGLARQLRSPVEKKLGRYQVEIPVFP